MKSANDIIAQARRMLTRRYDWNTGAVTWSADTPRQNRVLNTAARYLRNIRNTGADDDDLMSRSTYMGLTSVRSAQGGGK